MLGTQTVGRGDVVDPDLPDLPDDPDDPDQYRATAKEKRDQTIDPSSPQYQRFRAMLVSMGEKNTRSSEENIEANKKIISAIQSDARLKAEKLPDPIGINVPRVSKYTSPLDRLAVPDAIDTTAEDINNDPIGAEHEIPDPASTQVTFIDVMKAIVLYFRHVNFPVKLTGLVELQKAYGLLVTTCMITGYMGARFNWAMQQGIFALIHLIAHLTKVHRLYQIGQLYKSEKGKYDKLVSKLSEPRNDRHTVVQNGGYSRYKQNKSMYTQLSGY
jgi:hypothetical protein